MAVIERTREAPTSIFSPSLRTTSAGLLIVVTLIAFEAMAVAAALPTAARALHGVGGYGWAFTGFLVANIVAMVAAGQLCDARGPRLPLVAGLACFLGGLLLAGTAATMTQLVAGRVVQGLGSGLLITAVYVVAGEAYPERLRPRLFAATSSAWVLPALVGPAAAGVLAQHASWRWVFLGLVPFVLIGGALLTPVLRSLQPRAATRAFADPIQLVRAVAVAAGVAALEQAGQHPSLLSAAIAALGLAALAWGLWHLLPSGTFRARPGVPAPVAMRGLLAGSMFGAEVTVPLGLSVQHGYGAAAAGLPLTVSGFSWAFGSWLQGRADDSRGPQVRVRLIRSGFALMTVAIALMTLALVPGSTGLLAYPAWLIAGLGAGLTMSSVGVLLLNFTTDAERGADSAALQLSDATASALTTGLAGVFVAAAASGALGFTTAFVIVDLAMCAVAAVGVAIAGRARPA
ncbi:MAG TPA: MFS transporter [Jatrophihabitans sp.]|nr:MFS transporter [Jatrophihabitans sp.]